MCCLKRNKTNANPPLNRFLGLCNFWRFQKKCYCAAKTADQVYMKIYTIVVVADLRVAP